MFWAQLDADDDVSVFAAKPSVPPRRLLRVSAGGAEDRVGAELMASPQRLAVSIDSTWEGPDEALVTRIYEGSAAVTGRRIEPFRPRATRFGRLQDVAGHAVLTVVSRHSGARSSAQAYLRDLARRGGPPTPVGPRITLTPDERPVEARLTENWVALLRRTRDPVVTVYDRRTGRAAWTVALPPLGPGDVTYDRLVVWDLGEDGTLAAALDMAPDGLEPQPVFGWAAPSGPFQAIETDVSLQPPFLLDRGRLIFLSDRKLVAVTPGGAPQALTGVLPDTIALATDGRTVALTAGDRQTCVLAARLPVATDARWRC